MFWRDGLTPAPTIRTRRWPATKRCASRGRPGCSSFRAPKSASRSMHSNWDRLRREAAFVTRHGSTTGGVYRWIFGYDPVAQWRG